MTERLLNEQVAEQVRDVFKQLTQPVKVIYFGKKENCDYCDETLQLAREIVELSDLLSLEVYDLEDHRDTAEKYHVDKVPGLVIAATEDDLVVDFGVRYAGIPSGHEFSSLIHSMILVSGRDSGLSQESRKYLGELQKPVHLQVFVTPT